MFFMLVITFGRTLWNLGRLVVAVIVALGRLIHWIVFSGRSTRPIDQPWVRALLLVLIPLALLGLLVLAVELGAYQRNR